MYKTWSTSHKTDGHGKIWSREWLAPTGDKPMGHDDDDVPLGIRTRLSSEIVFRESKRSSTIRALEMPLVSRSSTSVMNTRIGSAWSKSSLDISFWGIFQVSADEGFFNDTIQAIGFSRGCLKYIRLGYDRVATDRSIDDVGQSSLVLIERRQPSMKSFIDEMFKNERDYFTRNETTVKQVDELEVKINELKEKRFKKTTRTDVKKVTPQEPVKIEKEAERGSLETACLSLALFKTSVNICWREFMNAALMPGWVPFVDAHRNVERISFD